MTLGSDALLMARGSACADDALLARMAEEPLLYASLIGRRGQLLAPVGSGTATEHDKRELEELRAKSAELGLRIDALGEALRRA